MKRLMVSIAMAALVAVPVWSDVLEPLDAPGTTVTMKSTAYVSGPVVTVADVAVIEGPDAETLGSLEIVDAAAPGASRRIDASLLKNRIQRAGYDGTHVSVTGLARTTATTMHLEITGEDLREDLTNFVHTSMPWDPDNTVIDIVPPGGTTVVSDGDVYVEWRTNPAYKYLGQGTFRGEISVDGRQEKTVYAKVNVQAYAEVLVSTRSIGRGEALNGANVSLEMRDLSKIRTESFFDVDEIAGSVAKSSIHAGQIISPRKVMQPKIVKRNQIVTVMTQVGALTIQSQAQALKDGAVGDVLACRNLKSKEEFMGILRKDGVVIVH